MKDLSTKEDLSLKKHYPHYKRQITKRLKLPPGCIDTLAYDNEDGKKRLLFITKLIKNGPYLIKIKKQEVYEAFLDKDLKTITAGTIHSPHSSVWY